MILAIAAEEFNLQGVRGASLERIAERAGISRNSLYVYVKDRDDLLRQCYLQEIAVMAQILDHASRSAGTGLGRVLNFIELALAPERRSTIAIHHELVELRTEWQAEIDGKERLNRELLTGFIRDGIADGSVRPCDPEVIVQCIVGMLSWIPQSHPMRSGAVDPVMRSQHIAEFVRVGISLRPVAAPCALKDDIAGWRGTNAADAAFDKDDVRAAKIEVILRAASEIFLRKGIFGPTIEDIAGAIGVTSGAVYHYFKSYDHLLYACYVRAYDIYDSLDDAAVREGRSGLVRLLQLIRSPLDAHAAGICPLPPMGNFDDLRRDWRDQLVALEARLVARSAEFIAEGIRAGDIRELGSPDLVLAACAGAVMRLEQWLAVTPSIATPRIVDELMALVSRGLSHSRA